MKEALIQAQHAAQFCVNDLRDALAKAGPVEALVILQAIEQARTTQHSIEALIGVLA